VDKNDDNVSRIRLRFEWGGEKPVLLRGVLELSEGKFRNPKTLGIESDAASSLSLTDGALWIKPKSARIYDGFDITLEANPNALLNLSVQTSENPPIRQHYSFPVKSLFNEIKNLPIGPTNLLIQRTPGDEIQFRCSSQHLIFQPRQEIKTVWGLNLLNSEKQTFQAKFSWKLSTARSNQLIQEGRKRVDVHTNVLSPHDIPVTIQAPEKEGVYNFDVALENNSETIATRTVQFVVIDPSRKKNTVYEPNSSMRQQQTVLIDEFSPSTAGFLRKIDAARLRPNPQLDKFNAPLKKLLSLVPFSKPGQSPVLNERTKINWSAYRLQILHTQKPHQLVISTTGATNNAFGVSLLEPNAAGQIVPLGLDWVMNAEAAASQPFGQSTGSQKQQFRVLFWPKVESPVLLVHDLNTGLPIPIDQVQVFELPDRKFQNHELETARPDLRRLVGAYLHKPLLAENFGATEILDAQSQRSLDDWTTFLTASERLVQYLGKAGFNSLMINVSSEGSTIYPSEILNSTPRFDSGRFFSNGQDPVQKDVLELLYRLFDREGYSLVPELQFSSLLPELEQLIETAGAKNEGVELIGSDGRSWQETFQSMRGQGSFYNPLHPQVQEIILQAVEELVGRYGHHTSFRGIALQLGGQGYLQFPNLDWGYDSTTLKAFESDTGIQLPKSRSINLSRQRYQFLTTDARQSWIDWRCKKLAEFYHRLASVVHQKSPKAKLILNGSRILRGDFTLANLSEAARDKRKIRELLLSKGLDLQLYSGKAGVQFLRPVEVSFSEYPSVIQLQQSINQDSQFDSLFSSTRSGSMISHMPREIRIPEFDAVSPWQPCFTWLAAHPLTTGTSARKRLVHALAQENAHAIFEGGWLVPLSEDESVSRTRRVLGSLPDIPFHKVANQQQPAIVRVARHNGKTYVSVVNDFPAPVHVTIQFSHGPQVAGRVLGLDEKLKIHSSKKQPSSVSVVMDDFDVWACEIFDDSVRLLEVKTELPNSLLNELNSKIASLENNLIQYSHNKTPQPLKLKNRSFEVAGNRENSLPGWHVPIQNASYWTLDQKNSRSGKSSLLLQPLEGRKQISLFSPELPLAGTRSLMVSLWMKSDQPKKEIRIAFESDYAGKKHRQSANLQIHQSWGLYRFHVKDLPAVDLKNARIKVEKQGAGKIWIDDVDIELRKITSQDQRQITKVLSALTLAWEEKRYADCQRLLDSYWGQYFGPPNVRGQTVDSSIPIIRTSKKPLRQLFRK